MQSVNIGGVVGAFFKLLATLIFFLGSINALAQQRYPIVEKAEWSKGTYTQQQAIDVGDVPGHKVRVLEVHYVYNETSELAFSGVKVKELWTRGYSDYTNGKGRSWGYGLWLLADGNKIFSEYSGTTLAEPTATGSIRGLLSRRSAVHGGN